LAWIEWKSKAEIGETYLQEHHQEGLSKKFKVGHTFNGRKHKCPSTAPVYGTKKVRYDAVLGWGLRPSENQLRAQPQIFALSLQISEIRGSIKSHRQLGILSLLRIFFRDYLPISDQQMVIRRFSRRISASIRWSVSYLPLLVCCKFLYRSDFLHKNRQFSVNTYICSF